MMKCQNCKKTVDIDNEDSLFEICHACGHVVVSGRELEHPKTNPFKSLGQKLLFVFKQSAQQ